MKKPYNISGKNVLGGKKTTKQSEINIANKFGGKRHAMSGAKPSLKGDGTIPTLKITDGYPFLFDIKETVKMSISLKTDVLAKLEQEAKISQKRPVLIIQFSESDVLKDRIWALLPLSSLEGLET